MPEEVDIACPGCNAIFGVPVDFCGEIGECAECGTMFRIPVVKSSENLTDTSAIKGMESDDLSGATNTVRLSRTGIGMIPQAREFFQLDVSPSASAPKKPVASPVSPSSAPNLSIVRDSAPPISSPKPAPKPMASAPVSSTSTPKSEPSVSTSAPPISKPETTSQDGLPEEIILPEWANIRMKKDEKIIGIQKGTTSSLVAVSIVSVATILAGVAGIAHEFIDYIPIAVVAVIVGIIWLIAFVVTMIMTKEKKVLVVTDQRVISVVGKSRMEVKK